MKIINKLESKFGKFSVPNLTIYIILCYIAGYVIELINPALIYYISLDPASILRGQVWRLVSWVLIPPSAIGSLNLFNILWIALILYCFYSIGSSVERSWGSFRYTLYIFSGIFFTIIGAFILYIVYGELLSSMMALSFSTYYINLSVFLAFAFSFPDMRILLNMVIPIKAKWIGYLDILYLANAFAHSSWAGRTAIIASVFNFILFFLCSRNVKPYTPKEMARKHKFKKQVNEGKKNFQNGQGAKHRCAVCGRTELDSPDLEFRYCSKCNGNYEYCQDHLFTHEHVK